MLKMLILPLNFPQIVFFSQNLHYGRQFSDKRIFSDSEKFKRLTPHYISMTVCLIVNLEVQPPALEGQFSWLN